MYVLMYVLMHGWGVEPTRSRSINEIKEWCAFVEWVFISRVAHHSISWATRHNTHGEAAKLLNDASLVQGVVHGGHNRGANALRKQKSLQSPHVTAL